MTFGCLAEAKSRTTTPFTGETRGERCLSRMQKFLLTVAVSLTIGCVAGAAPTDGFTEVPLYYYVQYPYDLELSDRYAVSNGTNRFWVYSTDQPFQQGSTTAPRTEMRIFNNYTNGVWQFEGDLYVPSGTTGAAVMQVFGGATAATASQLRVYNGSLCRYTTPIRSNIYDRWVHVNVIHDANTRTVSIYLDGAFVRSDPDRGAAIHYFKCGVYAQDNPSALMEAYWANVRVWRRAPRIEEIIGGEGSATIRGTNGTPGSVCYLLASMNVGIPLTNWTRMATNWFDGGGAFNHVDSSASTQPFRFYLLQTP